MNKAKTKESKLKKHPEFYSHLNDILNKVDNEEIKKDKPLVYIIYWCLNGKKYIAKIGYSENIVERIDELEKELHKLYKTVELIDIVGLILCEGRTIEKELLKHTKKYMYPLEKQFKNSKDEPSYYKEYRYFDNKKLTKSIKKYLDVSGINTSKCWLNDEYYWEKDE
jgi:hypothetical protein